MKKLGPFSRIHPYKCYFVLVLYQRAAGPRRLDLVEKKLVTRIRKGLKIIAFRCMFGRIGVQRSLWSGYFMFR
ncbi:hypothetical protein L1987_35434 [Smallanthus sonchifolius]|uniref:Uncharacterized protein n=1 Tax=Smallanthus sonchifolius TaxID=185202 RepID=A0ACB9HW00_9ASTR|nr:hypothetical protein L1987_35434 [Smallanthus sonchifolius]